MYGLEAISAHNGWAMTFLGISIVFAGLVFLSLFVSQIHKVLIIWDKRNEHFQRIKRLLKKNGDQDQTAPDPVLTQGIKDSARQCKLLSKWIGEPFSLPRLIDLAEKTGMSHPYSVVNDLLRTGLIIPDGKGFYYWKE